MKFMLAAFLAAHALIHLSYLSPAPPRTADGPAWPFDVAQSWLVTQLGVEAFAMRPLAAIVVTVGTLWATLVGGWVPSAFET